MASESVTVDVTEPKKKAAGKRTLPPADETAKKAKTQENPSASEALCSPAPDPTPTPLPVPARTLAPAPAPPVEAAAFDYYGALKDLHGGAFEQDVRLAEVLLNGD